MRDNQGSAILTGSLLARKGAAAPSNSFGKLFEASPAASQGLADRKPCDEAVRNENVALGASQQTSGCLRAAPSAEMTVGSENSGNGGPGRAKLSLRLDRERHLRLKIAAAHLGRSNQAILLDALDSYLEKIAPETAIDCVCLNGGA